MKILLVVFLAIFMCDDGAGQDTGTIKKSGKDIRTLPVNPETPRHPEKDVSIPKNQIPVIKPDTKKNERIPVKSPEGNQPMPVQRPDTSKSK